MKIMYICNNFGSSEDGIGDYSKNMYNSLSKMCDIDLMTADTIKYGKIRKIFSTKMSVIFIKAARKVKKEKYDCIFIEYPFVEWNPLLIFAFMLLKFYAKNNHVIIAFSIHEYDRVSYLRKMIIRFFVKRTNLYFVNNRDKYSALLKYNKKMFIRDIPSNINTDNYVFDFRKKNSRSFAFFGIVNKSKAFDEMLEGWYSFYSKNNDCELNIITSSENINYKRGYGIKYYYNANSKKIFDILSTCSYSVLPIIPNLSHNNGSLKTACGFACIPIGIFSEEMKKEKIGVNVSEYTPRNFEKIFNMIFKMSNDKKIDLMNKSLIFSQKYSFNNNSKIILNVLENSMDVAK